MMAIVWVALLAALPARADDAPGPEGSARIPAGGASSGFSGRSSTFRVDGRLADGRIAFRVARTDDATQVHAAHITVTSGPLIHRARAAADGEYSIPADDFFRGGRFPLTFVIEADGGVERVETAIDVASSVASKEAKAQHIGAVRDYLEGTMLITLGLMAALAAYLLFSRARARRSGPAAGRKS